MYHVKIMNLFRVKVSVVYLNHARHCEARIKHISCWEVKFRVNGSLKLVEYETSSKWYFFLLRITKMYDSNDGTVAFLLRKYITLWLRVIGKLGIYRFWWRHLSAILDSKIAPNVVWVTYRLVLTSKHITTSYKGNHFIQMKRIEKWLFYKRKCNID